MREQPERQRRNLLEPAVQDVGARNRLHRHHDHPEIPVQPAGHEAAQAPRPARPNSVNERTFGSVMAISPSMRITSSTSVPVIR
jgi:hypothetical protein